MSEATTLSWLQSIEDSLQTSIAGLTVKYQTAELSDKAQIYWALSKLNERRATVHNTIIDVLQDRLAIMPPSMHTIATTKLLTDNLQELVRRSDRFDAILTVLTDLSALLTEVVVDVPMPRPAAAIRASARV